MRVDGSFPPNPAEKPGYVLGFHDDFSGPELDPGKWFPYYLPQWSSRAQAAARYRLTGHSLELLIEQDQEPWCPEFDGHIRVSSLQTGCFAGPLGSRVGQHRSKENVVVREAQDDLRLYTPTYGFFETRLRAVPVPGYMVALWMIGVERRPEHSGEICICELFGHEMTDKAATVGYGVHPFGDPGLTDAFFRDELELDASAFHVYAAEWTPDRVDFHVDNRKLRTVTQAIAYPMQFMLNIYELPGQLAATSEGAAWPKVFEVDYVRGYRPLEGYEAGASGGPCIS